MIDLADRLRQYNAWRRGDDTEQPNATHVGQDIDAAIAVIECALDPSALVAHMMSVGVKSEYYGGFSEQSETGRMIVACAKIIREQLDSQKETEHRR